MTEIPNLDELFEAMKVDDPRTLDIHGQWRSDLPTFGGDAMDDLGIWSWNLTRMIVGTCADDLRIMNRDTTTTSALARRTGRGHSTVRRWAQKRGCRKHAGSHVIERADAEWIIARMQEKAGRPARR